MKKNNFKSLMQAAVLVCTPLVIASCDDVFGDVDNPISAHISIKDAPVSLALHKDSVARATYTRTAIAATGAEIAYSSDDEKVATVDAKTGKITAVGNGTCNIIAKSTGKDSRGNMTYQEEEVSFPVIVKDYRCRVDLIEGAEIPVYNSADANLAQIDMSEIVKAWPANVTLTYVVTEQPATPNEVVDVVTDPSVIALTGKSGTAKIKATIAAGDVPAKYENTSFPKNQASEEFEVTVKEGVAYISGYDATGKAIRKTMFKNYNNEKYTTLKEVMTAQPTGDITLKAGWYVVDATTSATALGRNIRVDGDVNLIMSNTLNMGGNNILDQSAEKSYELNIISDYDNKYNSVYNINKIQDFKKVTVDNNLSFNVVADPNFKNIGTLNMLTSSTTGWNIRGWKFENIGTLDITGAKLYDATGGNHVSFKTVETLNITNAAQLDYAKFTGIETLNITNKAALTVKAPEFTTVGALNVSKVNFAMGTSTAAAFFNKSIGTLSLTDATCLSTTFGAGDDAVTFGAINLKKSNMTCAQVVLADGGAITLDDGTFTATAAGDNYAVKGNVVVNKGTFEASSPAYHAVKGNLSGTTFYESSVGGTNDDDWSAITGTSSQEPYVKGKKE